ncbi:Bifunctional inhibitor/plant lipid transfer protein/seed storage helical domain [Macleaya cordata]|uniref:Bifunctional inhibitor/plant lipid transfer protein/seed storage helical domain n=1 Tax=Macleaya cordata TaxID=56857 RepID=A0A200R9X8_MACCD|nr:Bifunctional inhibitor/plant lipid transfer protein/seed storage helical domain [Macleaya cordata]
MGCSKRLVLMMVVVVMGVLMVEETRAQVPDCASNLVSCADYLNSTKPPESCCKPLRETVLKQRKCLCDLYDEPSLLQSLGINITQALQLPQYCGVSADTSLCSKASAPSPTKTPSPPGVPGGDNGSAASKMAWTGLSSLLLFWVSLIA